MRWKRRTEKNKEGNLLDRSNVNENTELMILWMRWLKLSTAIQCLHSTLKPEGINKVIEAH